jgi:Arc/MetJ-type ribon-helix-helix transcriptional regulator
MLHIRLPEPLEQELAQEARNAHKSRSEVAREALSVYLHLRRRRRFMGKLQDAASALDGAEARTLANESLPLDEEALGIPEGGGRYAENVDKWWK